MGNPIYSREIDIFAAYSWYIQQMTTYLRYIRTSRNTRLAILARLFPIYSRHIEKTRHIHESCVLAPRQTVDIFKHVEFLRMWEDRHIGEKFDLERLLDTETWESLEFGTNFGILLAYSPAYCRDVEYPGNMSGFFVCSVIMDTLYSCPPTCT